MGNRSASRSEPGWIERRGDVWFPIALATVVLVSRVLCRGPVYFADGPGMIGNIVAKIYVIQPPGYWLFMRIAGLFSDPAAAIRGMNFLFSIAGVVVFYYTARVFTGAWNAFVGALAYSTVFYVWFSGEIHSTYASQILFPVATFYALLRYDRDHSKWMLGAAALLFSLGAGLRPSDGAFVAPMVVYYTLTRMPRRARLPFLLLIAALCLGWVAPTILAYPKYGGGIVGAGIYMEEIVSAKSIFAGVNLYTLANSARYAIPLVVAFWPVVAVAVVQGFRNRSDWRVKLMLLWIGPGSLFFVLILITDPTYLNFLSAAILLLAVSAPRRMLVTALWNAILFLAIRPIPVHNFAVDVVNSYITPYTRFGIEHQWWSSLSRIERSGK
jgi:hypothetical protein